LGQHQVCHIGFPDLIQHLFVCHSGLQLQFVDLGGVSQLFAVCFTMELILEAGTQNLNEGLDVWCVGALSNLCKGNSYKAASVRK
jgi:hypothetical protein